MLARLKVGGHTGPTGYGIPDSFIDTLDAAGIPVFMKSADATSGILKVQHVLEQGSQVAHTFVYRQSGPGPEYDVPDYTKSPEDASDEHWARHMSTLPPELDFSLGWLETVNEVRNTQEAASWIGEFLYYQGLKAIEEGKKFCGPGYASGDPEEGSWETPGMLQYLRLCEQYPDQIAIALHEYSLNEHSLWTKKNEQGDIVPCTEQESGYWLIGRFTKLFEVCDRHGIRRPKVLITEAGWSLWSIPNADEAIRQLIDVGRLYAQYPEVLGGGLWYLGDGWQGINIKVWQLFEITHNRLLEATLNTLYIVDDTPEPPNDNLLLNASFEDSWSDVPPAPDRIQQPNEWAINVLVPGDEIWAINRATGQPSIVTDIPECTHKHNWQLPPNEQLGGQDAIILHGMNTYKMMQAPNMVAGVELKQTILGLTSGETVKLICPLQVHYQDDYIVPDQRPTPPEVDDIEFHILINDELVVEAWQNGIISIPNREWIYLEADYIVPSNGILEISLRAMTKWANSRDFFIDDLSLEVINDTQLGDARIPYDRTYVRVNSSATLDQWLSTAYWSYQNRYTLGFSNDDAGIGVGLHSKRIIEVGGEFNEQEIEDWYQTHYGVIDVTHMNYPTSDKDLIRELLEPNKVYNDTSG